jgi:dihydroorotase
MRKLVIRNGRVIDPVSKLDAIADVLIEEGRIAAVGEKLQVSGAERFDASGLVVAPGFVDMHVHLREPGFEYAETIETGARAAAAGGFTTICCMPNTSPINDNVTVTSYIIERAARHAMETARSFGIPVIDHCEDLHLSAGGDMHEGIESVRLGLRGIPAASEDVMVARDILLAQLTGARFHVAHISSRYSVDMVAFAKSRGIAVTCEATPHHFTLSDSEMPPYDSNYKMKPPLRSACDAGAVTQGLISGTVDAIATDHAPHAGSEKMQEFEKCPFGVIGLETAVGLALERLVHPGKIPLARMLELFSSGPARVLNLEAGRLAVGAPADVTILSLERRWTYDVNKSASKSRNSPFNGHEFRGGPMATIVNGRVVWKI